MDLDALARMIARHGWLAVVMAGLGVAVGLVIGRLQSPLYEATTRVALSPARPADLGQNQAVREIMPSYIEDLRTHDMAAAAAAQLGDGYLAAHGLDAEALHGLVRIDADANVFEILVKARHADPAVAVQVSEKWSLAFTDQRAKANQQLELRERIFAHLRDQTRLSQAAPRRKLLVAVGAVLGALAGGLAVLVWEFLARAVIVAPAEAEQLTDSPALAAIPGRRRGSGLAVGLADAGRAVRATGGQLVPVVLLAGVGLASGLAFAALQPTVYRARTKIAVEPALGTDWGRTQAIPEFMKNLAEDLRTARMAEAINAELGLDLPPERLLEQVTVAPRESVFEVHLDVRDPDRDTAIAISRAWAARFVEQRNQANLDLDQQDRVLVRLRDRTTAERYAPRTLASAAAGLLVGALVGIVAVGLLALRRGRWISDRRSARRSTGSAVVGEIPRRGGARAGGPPRAAAPTVTATGAVS